ncbi:MAG: immunoglobulin domain-containing protein [Planctomycetes bacterium]|nr:immunoglobulin domain-containing protein [Planctomycetota bacterium]
MQVRHLSAGWRLAGLTLASGALLATSVSPPLARSQDRDPASDGVLSGTTAVAFWDWYNPVDPNADLGPIAVCFDGRRPPPQDFIDSLMTQLFNAGSLPETYHLVHPDSPYLNNRFVIPGAVGPDGGALDPVIFSWWEHDGSGGGGGGYGERYWLGNRWSGSQGAPRTLTWSFVPDGLTISGGAGEAATASSLFSRMDSLYAAQGGRATWINRVVQSFNRWHQLSGLSYTRITSGGNDWDDGASWGSAGSGTRGDLRVSMHNIDGANGILAYTYFPSNGDMVFDSSESWGSTTNNNRFFRDTFMHEHGHGFGLDHVCSNNASFLMEPFLNTGIDGPMHDDIRAGKRHYGDPEEIDDSTATANDMGTIAFNTTHNTFCNLPAPVSGTNPANTSNCSIDANAEVDFYKFTVTGTALATITVTPVGFSYNDNAQAANGSCPTSSSTNSLTRANLAVDLIGTNGTTVIASASAAASGVAETISSASLPSAGTYFIKIYETDTPTQTQLYTLSVNVQNGGCVAPAITTHPLSDALCINDAVTFNVIASGSTPMTFQWRKDGGNIGGATSDSYTIDPITLGDGGSYDCVVTNACGNATSNAATLTVITVPTINTHPSNQTVTAGATVQFTVGATGAGPLLYTWRKGGFELFNGGNIAGADTATLTVSNAQDADEGVYTCDVQNGCGAVTSNGATLTVNPPGCPGDFNHDSIRDLGDLTILLSNFGTASGATADQGDVDGDGDVDLTDLSAFLAMFGSPC